MLLHLDEEKMSSKKNKTVQIRPFQCPEFTSWFEVKGRKMLEIDRQASSICILGWGAGGGSTNLCMSFM